MLIPQRGAIHITLDRKRILFFDMQASWLLFNRFGDDIIAALFTREKQAEAPEQFNIKLTSPEALQFYLWAGLQAEAREHGETVTLEQCGDFIRPLTIRTIFAAVARALMESTVAPEPPPGKADAPGPTAKPRVVKKAGQPSTLLTRSASPTRRSRGR